MTTTTRAALAACLFTAIVAGTIAPRFASAHPELSEEVRTGATRRAVNAHWPLPPLNFRVQRLASSPHNAIVVSWDAAHLHPHIPSFTLLTGCSWIERRVGEGRELVCPTREIQPAVSYSMKHYRIAVYTQDMNPQQDGVFPNACPGDGYGYRRHQELPRCIRQVVAAGTGRHSTTITGLQPGTSYSVAMLSFYNINEGTSVRSTWPFNLASITTASSPDVPTSQTCTYEHRLIGVPGGAAYSGRILISSKAPNATATIRAYQADNGHRIDVLDADGRDVETVSLDPANSVKRFTIEAAQGWHPVIVAHPSESAMQAATVAMRYRDGGSLEDSYPPGIKHCEPTSTGPVTVTDSPTVPETPSPPEPETPDPVTPEPEPTAPTAPELAVALSAAVRDAGTVAVTGTVTNAGTTASAPTRIRFLNGRRRVHTATVPAIGGGGVHTISADVAMPDGDAIQVCIVPKGRDADPSNDCDTASVTTGQ